MRFAAQLTVEEDMRALAPRRPLGVDATLRDTAARPLDVTVMDMSTTGFAVTSATPLTIGAVVRLGVGGVAVAPATVVRQQGQVFGCRFVRPISADQVQAVSGESTIVVGAFPAPAPSDAPAQPGLSLRARAAIILSISLTLWVVLIALGGAIHHAVTAA